MPKDPTTTTDESSSPVRDRCIDRATHGQRAKRHTLRGAIAPGVPLVVLVPGFHHGRRGLPERSRERRNGALRVPRITRRVVLGGSATIGFHRHHH